MTELVRLLIAHEGMRLKPYRCTKGKLTIGVGRNLESLGISEREAMYLLEQDVRRVAAECNTAFSWMGELVPARRTVILCLAFAMGITSLKGFVKMAAAIEKKDWAEAALEIMKSEWAREVGPARSQELARIMLRGDFHDEEKDAQGRKARPLANP